MPFGKGLANRSVSKVITHLQDPNRSLLVAPFRDCLLPESRSLALKRRLSSPSLATEAQLTSTKVIIQDAVRKLILLVLFIYYGLSTIQTKWRLPGDVSRIEIRFGKTLLIQGSAMYLWVWKRCIWYSLSQ